MRFDLRSQCCQGADLLVGEAGFVEARAGFSACGITALTPSDDDPLIPETPLNDLGGRSIDDEMIRIGRPGDNRFTQARIGIDDRLTPFASERISREEDTRDRSFDHALDDDREPDTALIDAQTGTVAHGAISPERGPA